MRVPLKDLISFILNDVPIEQEKRNIDKRINLNILKIIVFIIQRLAILLFFKSFYKKTVHGVNFYLSLDILFMKSLKISTNLS